MALTPEQQDALARLAEYNGGRFVISINERGLGGDGYKVNFAPACNDVATVAGAVFAVTGAALTAADAVAINRNAVSDLTAIATNKAGEAVAARDAAAAAAAGLHLPPITIADAGKALVVAPDGSGYVTGSASGGGSVSLTRHYLSL